MNYDEITNKSTIESILEDFRIGLEDFEYDDEDELQQYLVNLESKVRPVAKRAAELGSIQGMHLYGLTLAYEADKLREEGQPYLDQMNQAKELVINAAKGGCWGAMSDLGTECPDILSTTIIEQIAFIKLSDDGDLREHIQYCREYLGMTITQDDIDQGLKLYEQLHNYMESQGIEKQSCDCIFP